MTCERQRIEYSSYTLKEQCPNCFYLFTTSSHLKYCEHCGTTEKRKVVLSRNKYKITKKSFLKNIFSIYNETIDFVGTETMPYEPDKKSRSSEKEMVELEMKIYELIKNIPFVPTEFLVGTKQSELFGINNAFRFPCGEMKIVKMPDENFIGFR